MFAAQNRLLEQQLTISNADTFEKEHTVRLKTCENNRFKKSLEQANRKRGQIPCNK